MMTSPTSSAEHSYPTGSVIAEKYRVEGLLGVGGMGAVLEATHVGLGHRVALKVLHPSAVGLGDAVPRFLREARSTAALESEHVVRIFDLGTTPDGMPFLVMERLTGFDLDHLLSKLGVLPVGLAIECVYQAALGVREAHAAGIIHRDLKPSNLFLARTGNGNPLVKVLDFGISKLQDETQNLRLTETRSIVGSPQYMSPEQVRDARSVSVRSDVWALGAILHELLDGRPAFTGDTLPSVCAAIVSDEPAEMRRTGLPEELELIRQRCLVKDPTLRIASVDELIRELLPVRRLVPSPELDRLSIKFPEKSSRESSVNLETLVQSRAIYSQATVADSSDARALPKSNSGVRPLPDGPPTLTSASVTSDSERPIGPRRYLWPGLAVIAFGAVSLVLWNQTRIGSSSQLDAPKAQAVAPAPLSVIEVTSDPVGALIKEHGRVLGQTPARLPLSFDEYRSREIELHLDGYHPHLLTVSEQNLGRPIEVMLIALPTPTAPDELAPKEPVVAETKKASAPAPVVRPRPRPVAIEPKPAPSDIRMSR